jgi:hypothetical protein
MRVPTPDFGSPGRLLSKAIGALRALLPDVPPDGHSSRAEQLRLAFAAAARSTSDAQARGADGGGGIPIEREQLRRQAALFAIEMRDAGLPPEQMLVALKAELKGASTVRRPVTNDSLFADVIRWAIDAYFAR